MSEHFWRSFVFLVWTLNGFQVSNDSNIDWQNVQEEKLKQFLLVHELVVFLLFAMQENEVKIVDTKNQFADLSPERRDD